MIKFDDYDKIIIDGFGTLYDQNYVPFDGAAELLRLICNKVILFSNVGSIKGSELKNILQAKTDLSFTNVITSLDLLCDHIVKNKIKKIYHYGGISAENELNKIACISDSIDEIVDAIIFTSLPQKNWITESQDILKYINFHMDVKVILGNPDRLLPGSNVGINIGMMFDMLIQPWINEGFQISKIEIGKPNLNRLDLSLTPKEKLLVIGDNYITDGGLADQICADFALITKNERFKSKNIMIFSNLINLMNNVKV